MPTIPRFKGWDFYRGLVFEGRYETARKLLDQEIRGAEDAIRYLAGLIPVSAVRAAEKKLEYLSHFEGRLEAWRDDYDQGQRSE